MSGRLIQYSKEFDVKFRYDGKDLGAICSNEGTIFKIWCPLADKVELHLYCTDSASEYTIIEMIPQERGTFRWECPESLHGTYYDYTVYRDGEATRTADPYAYSCGCNGIRSMVVDLRQTDPEGFEEDKAPAVQAENIIYELHVKDFSHDPDSGVPQCYRGKYKAFTVSGTNGKYPTCMEYLKQLGITHVHLLPIYDFGWLDENGSDEQFNWGYDPVNYNVPEGSFSTDPHDGGVRIRECKEMIRALHENGIRVIMDVVYNHTYQPDSWLERMVPGYYNRRWADGSLSNGSACGNDIACGRAMVDNYIADSVMYWAKEYHIDGFRFDLMGLLTVDLMNRIRKELDREFGKGEKLLYGEPWTADDSPMEKGTKAALKSNVHLLDEGVAIFTDDTRDVIKGHVFYKEEPGFVNGGKGLEAKLLEAVTAWCKPDEDVGNKDCDNGSFRPKSCSQIINYVSAHDNFTLWDKLVLSMHGGDMGDILKANKLAAFIYFTCQGHLFLQAGEEFGRTKFGDDNSYRSDPRVNMLRWQQTQEFRDLLEYYKGLIRLRKKSPGLYDKSKDAASRVSGRKILKEGVVSFLLDNSIKDPQNAGTQQWAQLYIVYNGNPADAEITVPEGDWMILADGSETDCLKELRITDGRSLTISAVSGMMLGRIDS